ncbi:ceramide kinase-like protein [Syngnathus typhle]|uniref:ceramide kinase-like protein n=1 Tax=Syngnathus typhle TaxID=161592 RepID=UPI002A69BD0F|nr:ceramide kinase-like protein [Syngnathus typhle]
MSTGEDDIEKKEQKKRKEKEQEEREPDAVERSDGVLLRGIFKVGKKSHDVLLTATRLTWTPVLPESPAGEACPAPPAALMLRDVLAVKVKRRRSAGRRSGGPVLGLALFFCKRRGRRLEEDTLHLHNASSEHARIWYDALRELLAGVCGRPRRLKVFINPSSHKKEAVHVYREHVAPLFKMADVCTDITVTEKRGHALSVMKELNVDDFDGLVCVGGDGFVAEICHAVVLRAQLDADYPCVPVRAALPLGIIPAGSTDVISCSVHGVRDPVTAAMHIILGHVQRADMCSLRSAGQPPRFAFAAMFGFGARSLARAEKKRWMAPARRRHYALLKTLARLRAEDCQLSFLTSRANNQDPNDHDDGDSEGAESWSSAEGPFLSIGVMAIPCLSPHAPRGLAPNTKLANGSAALIAVRATSRSDFVKHLKSYGAPGGQLDFSFVETHAVTAVRLRPRGSTACTEDESDDGARVRSTARTRATSVVQSDAALSFPWNIDGELLEFPNEVVIRLHGRLIGLYGEDVDEAESAAPCGCI